MKCMEFKTDINTELYQAIHNIINMKESGIKYKYMYVLLDVAKRLRTNNIVAPLNETDVFADYGIIIEDGKITDCGNTDIDIWKNKLIMSGGFKNE